MSHEEREEAPSGEPEEAKESIDEEGATREVAARFEQLEGDREDHDLRHEREDGAGAGEDAVRDERREQPLAEQAIEAAMRH